MNSRNIRITAAATLALVLAAAPAVLAGTTAGRWLHVRVTGDHDEQVSINVPLDMVEAMLPMIQTNEMRDGRIRIDSWDRDVEGIDLRALLKALREAPDADFVTVRSDDENVRVTKEGGFIKVEANSRWDSEKVRVRVPMAVIDALIGDDPYELDLIAALQALAEFEGEDLVTVESDDELVRIWIDGNQDGN